MQRFSKNVIVGFLAVVTLGNFAVAESLDSGKPDPGNSIIRILGRSEASSKLSGVQANLSRTIPAYWQKFPTGASNTITDVPGVRVGQLSLLSNHPSTIRTGITAILPPEVKGQTIANTGFPAAGAILNGNGEVTGLAHIQQAGILNGPILLTNTRSVGIVYEGIWMYFQTYFPRQWNSELPVVAECWDGFFNDIQTPVVTADDVVQTIQNATSAPVLQGRIGAGTGMRSFELHAGIGSASRKIKIADQDYTIGILVNTNHSRLDALNPLLVAALEKTWGKPLRQVRELDNLDQTKMQKSEQPRQGSIIVVIATDLPLNTCELQQVAQHAALGIAQAGGTMATTSGDFAMAWSTANPIRLDSSTTFLQSVSKIRHEALTNIFQATIEAIVEAQFNALVASHSQ